MQTFATAVGKSDVALANEVRAVLVADIRRGAPLRTAWTADTPDRLICVARDGSDEVLVAASELLVEAAAAAPAASVTFARLVINAAAARRDLDFVSVADDDVMEAVAVGGSRSKEAVTEWLSTEPPAPSVLAVLGAVRHDMNLHRAVQEWAQHLSQEEGRRTYFAALDADGLDGSWIPALATAPLDAVETLNQLANRLRDAPNAPARERVASAVHALKPAGYHELHAVAEMVLDLLANDPTRVKVDVAADLALLLREHYGLKGQLSEAAASAEAAGKVGSQSRKKLEQAALLGPKKPKGLDRLRGALGR